MQQLFDIKKTQIEMVRDRGYVIPLAEMEILNGTYQNFITYVESLAANTPQSSKRLLLTNYYKGNNFDGSEKRMLVFFGGLTDPGKKQISSTVIKEFTALCQKYAFTEAVLIVDAPLSVTSSENLSKLTMTSWQVFHDSDLTYNPTTHGDTHRHELLSPEVAQAKLREMKVEKSKIIILRSDDPIVKYYGWSVESIIAIHRDDSSVSILSPKSINYRVIV